MRATRPPRPWASRCPTADGSTSAATAAPPPPRPARRPWSRCSRPTAWRSTSPARRSTCNGGATAWPPPRSTDQRRRCRRAVPGQHRSDRRQLLLQRLVHQPGRRQRRDRPCSQAVYQSYVSASYGGATRSATSSPSPTAPTPSASTSPSPIPHRRWQTASSTSSSRAAPCKPATTSAAAAGHRLQGHRAHLHRHGFGRSGDRPEPGQRHVLPGHPLGHRGHGGQPRGDRQPDLRPGLLARRWRHLGHDRHGRGRRRASAAATTPGRSRRMRPRGRLPGPRDVGPGGDRPRVSSGPVLGGQPGQSSTTSTTARRPATCSRRRSGTTPTTARRPRRRWPAWRPCSRPT